LMKMVDMIPVVSSNIDSVGYDNDKQELHVMFKGGKVYIYEKVYQSVHSNMMAADSIGGFLSKTIKPHYKFRKVVI
jgi:KTSC domain